MNEWQGKQKYSEETCSSAALSTTNPISLDPGRRGGKPVTKSLSYVTAYYAQLHTAEQCFIRTAATHCGAFHPYFIFCLVRCV
jgi:hypothetical protein